MSAKLIGVGVGPGDPDLLTVKAIRFIQNAPVLAYPIDDEGYSRARETAAAHIRAGQIELPLLFSMSTERIARLKTRLHTANQVLEILQKGSDVVFITEGDPLLYSTFQHLLSFLPGDIPVEICPGISSMSAAAAAARFPLAIEGQGVSILVAKSALGTIGDHLKRGQTLVLFKAAHYLKEIATEVRDCDFRCDAVLVEDVSSQKEVVLRGIESWIDCRPSYFCVVLIHKKEAKEYIK